MLQLAQGEWQHELFQPNPPCAYLIRAFPQHGPCGGLLFAPWTDARL